MVLLDKSPAAMSKMFDAIAPCYDRLNRFFSFGLDLLWRRALARHLPVKKDCALLDLATGSGDQLLVLCKKIHPKRAVGVDISPEMIKLASKKLAPYQSFCSLHVGDMLNLPYPDNSFDLITISFGMRNVPDPSLLLKEIGRLLRPKGHVAILELTTPDHPFLKKLHQLYLHSYLPRVGKLFSGSQAYDYLNRSICAFPDRFSFIQTMHNAGFPKSSALPLSGGIATLFIAEHVS